MLRVLRNYLKQPVRLALISSLTFIFLLNFNKVYSQRQPYYYHLEVTYKMTFQPDSTDSKSVSSEFESLFVGNEQSLFCASAYLVIDSAISSESSKGNKLGPSMSFLKANGTHNHVVIFKSDSVITTFDQIPILPPTLYRYKESKPLFKWNILSDTISIGGIVCQKAETTFGNRKWVAWFAQSIPISDGPYKFCGLPGLILKINDTQQYWNFTLASLTKRDTTIKINFLNEIPHPIKDKNTFLAQKQYSRDNRFELLSLNGARFIDKERSIKYFRDLAKKNNNWIELYKGNVK